MKAKSASRPSERNNHLAVFLLLAVIFAAAAFSGYLVYRRHNVAPFVYTEHLQDVIVTVDGVDVTLAAFAYYVHEVEGFVQRQALIYDPEHPEAYWNTHYSAGMKSTFMFDYAMKTALDVCVFDLIYAQEALDAGYALSDAGRNRVEEETRIFWNGMSSAQRAATGIRREDVALIEERKALVSEYLTPFAQTVVFSGYDGTPAQLLSYDGDYYLREILPRHTVEKNEALIARIRMGTVTVNRKE